MTPARLQLVAIIVAVVLVLLLVIVAVWLLGPTHIVAVGGLAGAGVVAQRERARQQRELARQQREEEADDIIGGLGPDPATRREQAAQDEADIAAEVAGMTTAELLEEWRRGRRG